VVAHSERESHLTPPLDALQWTIFGPVTIQHQNRQIKITSHPRPIDSTRAPAGAAQLSHQTLRGFGPRPISWRGAVNTTARRLVAHRAFSPRSQRCSSLTAAFFSRLAADSRLMRRGVAPALAICSAAQRARRRSRTACCRTPYDRPRGTRAAARQSALARCVALEWWGSARELTCWQVDSRRIDCPSDRSCRGSKDATNLPLPLRRAVLLAQQSRRRVCQS
jgi:hypothetical protein